MKRDMTKVNSEEYNKALEEYLQEGIGWDAGMFDINAKNNQGDYEQFAADSFHAGWQAANESEDNYNDYDGCESDGCDLH